MDEKKVTKVVVSKEDELTDLVTSILESPNERIVFTFAEETDLLISPINLKVLLETADEREKLVIAQIIKNPTGLRNANLAGLLTIDTPSFPEEAMWEKEEENRVKRMAPPKRETIERKEPVEEIEKPSDFQKRVDEAIQKTRKKKETPESKDDLLISLDEDLPVYDDIRPKEEVLEKEPDLSTPDFDKKIGVEEEKREKRERKKFALSSFMLKIKDFFKKIPLPDKFKKVAPIIGLSVVLLLVLIAFIYINTAIIAKVDVYIEAKEVEIEEIFQGDENIKEIDFENFKIPVKTESVEKARSTNITATGTAFKGEKATGPINIFYVKDDCEEDSSLLELQAGTIVNREGLSFTLDSAVSAHCGKTTEAAITAVEVGEEYNLAKGKLFIFQGFSGDTLFAYNSDKALAGGSKEEYTILTKADVDAGVGELQGIAFEEGEGELKGKKGSWEIIPDSVTSEVISDSIKTGVSIGSEAGQVNLSIKTKTSATYFLKEGFDKGIENRLTQKAKDEDLFESDSNWKLELDKDIEKDISILESNPQGIQIRLIAKSLVKPKVDKSAIAEELKSMKWEKGKKYLNKLGFSEKKPKVEFLPEWFPKNLRYFPKRRGGIMITIKNI